ncbi:MAG: NAD(P)-dependent alcohol dehydrogenase [Deltaproteobacteria bacterium]|nr:NAD(P)-dependent alcohol dehydrogenase [Deltaproteobacteria bacterium]
MKIKAVVSPAIGQPFQIDEVELDEVRSNEVLVRIVGTGLCHTDLFFKDLIPLPAVFGHEGAGIVEKIGNAVTAVQPGDRVAISYNSCGFCKNCLRGMPFYCVNWNAFNYSGARGDGSMPITKDGAPLYGSFFGQSSLADFSLATERNVVKVPDDVPLEILGPLGCAVQTGAGTVINALKARAGSSIAVFGTGSVGLSAVMAAKLAGCSSIIAIDIKPNRLELAKELGATHIINGAEKNAVDEIRAITGSGADYSIDSTGVPEIVRQAIDAIDLAGRCAIFASSPIGTDAAFNMNEFVSSGKGVIGIIEGEAVAQIFIPQLIDLYKQGKFPFDKMIKFYDAKDINKAVEDSEKGVTLKPVIRFDR